MRRQEEDKGRWTFYPLLSPFINESQLAVDFTEFCLLAFLHIRRGFLSVETRGRLNERAEVEEPQIAQGTCGVVYVCENRYKMQEADERGGGGGGGR